MDEPHQGLGGGWDTFLDQQLRGGNMADPLAALRAEVKAIQHEPYVRNRMGADVKVCGSCGADWPCDAARLAEIALAALVIVAATHGCRCEGCELCTALTALARRLG